MSIAPTVSPPLPLPRPEPAPAESRPLQHRAAVPLLYLAAIALAEVLTALVHPYVGLIAHALVLASLITHGARTADEPRRALLWGLALAPLIRILSLSLPLQGLPLVMWYGLTSLPVFAAAFAAIRALHYTRREIGLVFSVRQVPLDLAMLVIGLVLGLIEYLILQPRPLARGLSPGELALPTLILAISTGFEEELIFRGMLQQAAGRVLGLTGGLLYVSVLFAVLHTGYLSPVDIVFVFLVGLLFAVVARRTGSILGPTLAHAGVNISMFLVWPYLLPMLLQPR